MTREEAIEQLQNCKELIHQNGKDWLDERDIPLLDMAIEALSANAVEVVRCKDCKYWNREIHNGVEYFNFSSCDLNHYGDGHNFYCADGERIEP